MKQRAKKEKELKRAMVVAWSDSDSSDSNNKEQQMEDLCFMANEDLIQEDETEYESSNEVDYSDFLNIRRMN